MGGIFFSKEKSVAFLFGLQCGVKRKSRKEAETQPLVKPPRAHRSELWDSAVCASTPMNRNGGESQINCL